MKFIVRQHCWVLTDVNAPVTTFNTEKVNTHWTIEDLRSIWQAKVDNNKYLWARICLYEWFDDGSINMLDEITVHPKPKRILNND